MSSYITKEKDSDIGKIFVIVNYLPSLIKNHCKSTFNHSGYFIDSFSDFSKNEYEPDIYPDTRNCQFKDLDAEFQTIMKEEFS
jgi:hypothetical protein